MDFPENLTSYRPEQMKSYVPGIQDGRPWPRALAFPDLSFPLATHDMRGHPPLCAHDHEGFSEIVIIYAGEGTHFADDGEYAINPGDVFVVPCGMVHGYRTVDYLHLVNIVYDDAYLMHGMSEIRRLPGFHALFHLEPKYRSKHSFENRMRLNSDELAHLLSMVETMAVTIREGTPGFQFRARVLFMRIVCFLCDHYGREDTPTQRSIVLMDNIIQHLHENYAENITLSSLAEIAQLSERSLLVLFKDATGYSPIEYLIRIRVACACELLRSTDLKVTDIAYQTGFTDSNYFTKQFGRHMGLQPREYRKQAVAQPKIP